MASFMADQRLLFPSLDVGEILVCLFTGDIAVEAVNRALPAGAATGSIERPDNLGPTAPCSSALFSMGPPAIR